MKKSEFIKQFESLEREAQLLHAESVIQKDTAFFLSKECDKLTERSDLENIPYDEKEKTFKQIEALMKRMEIELKMLNDSLPKLLKIETKLEELKKIATAGVFDDE